MMVWPLFDAGLAMVGGGGLAIVGGGIQEKISFIIVPSFMMPSLALRGARLHSRHQAQATEPGPKFIFGSFQGLSLVKNKKLFEKISIKRHGLDSRKDSSTCLIYISLELYRYHKILLLFLITLECFGQIEGNDDGDMCYHILIDIYSCKLNRFYSNN